MASEYHTSDLTSPCLRRVQLRHEGKAIGQTTTALYRGLLFHDLVSAWHHRGVMPKLALARCAEDVGRKLIDERRPMTEAVVASLPDIQAEVVALAEHYVARFREMFAKSHVWGVELPVRLTIDVDGTPAKFASHIDILYTDPAGVLCVDDWKTGDADWDGEHVARSMQLGMYFLALKYGSVQVDGEWVEFGAEPMLAFVDANALKPYNRKTTGKGDDGEEREFAKGDLRPMRAVRREIAVVNEAAIVSEFSLRVRMARAGMFPMVPSADGCRYCECWAACPTWTKEGGSADF